MIAHTSLGVCLTAAVLTTTADDETWTRAEVVASAPAINDSQFGGTYGNLNVNQSGAWTYTLLPGQATSPQVYVNGVNPLDLKSPNSDGIWTGSWAPSGAQAGVPAHPKPSRRGAASPVRTIVAASHQTMRRSGLVRPFRYASHASGSRLTACPATP